MVQVAAPSAPIVTAAVLPTAPAVVSVTTLAVGATTTAVVSLSVPDSLGGLPLTRYNVSADAGDGSPAVTASASTPVVILAGLLPGRTYRLSPSATTAYTSAPAEGAVVAVAAAAKKDDRAPTIVAATASAASATVSVAPPAGGGEAPEQYIIVAARTGSTERVNVTVDAGSPAVLSGLTSGATYAITAVGAWADGRRTPASPRALCTLLKK